MSLRRLAGVRDALRRDIRRFAKGTGSVRPVLRSVQTLAEAARAMMRSPDVEPLAELAIVEYLERTVRRAFLVVRPAPRILVDWADDNADLLQNL
jgi:hypothetical protein